MCIRDRELNRLTKTFIFLHASRSKVDYRQARAKKPREMEVHSRGFSDVCASLNGLIAVGHRDAQRLTVRGVVHLGHGRIVLDCQLGHVRLAGEDLDLSLIHI